MKINLKSVKVFEIEIEVEKQQLIRILNSKFNKKKDFTFFLNGSIISDKIEKRIYLGEINFSECDILIYRKSMFSLLNYYLCGNITGTFMQKKGHTLFTGKLKLNYSLIKGSLLFLHMFIFGSSILIFLISNFSIYKIISIFIFMSIFFSIPFFVINLFLLGTANQLFRKFKLDLYKMVHL